MASPIPGRQADRVPLLRSVPAGPTAGGLGCAVPVQHAGQQLDRDQQRERSPAGNDAADVAGAGGRVVRGQAAGGSDRQGSPGQVLDLDHRQPGSWQKTPDSGSMSVAGEYLQASLALSAGHV